MRLLRLFFRGACYGCGRAARFRCSGCGVMFCAPAGCPLAREFHVGSVPL